MKRRGPRKPGKADYVVGYGRPPKATQFKRGVSGNKKGRPEGSKNIAKLFQQEMFKKIPVVVNGQRRMTTKLEAALMQLANKAATGDPKAIQSTLNIARELGVMNLPDPTQGPEVRTFTLNIFDRDLKTGEMVRVKTVQHGDDMS